MHLIPTIGIFSTLWCVWSLWQQLVLPQVSGIWTSIWIHTVIAKPLVWGLAPCCVFLFRNRTKEGEKVNWFEGKFPGLPCVALLCMTVAFLHTLRLLQGLGDTFVEFDWTFLLFSVSAGVVEEIGFRGCFFEAQRREAGFWPAALLSSGMFTLFHYPELLFGGSAALLLSARAALIFIMGIAFCAMYHKWKNLGLNMVVHTVWDVLSYLFCLF